MIPIKLLLAILATHFVADFIVQTDWQAVNKSHNLRALGGHVGTYTLVMLLFGPKFALLNGALHFSVDFVTSKMTAHYWKQQRRHTFFVVVGADQLLHETCLVLSAAIAWRLLA